MVRKGTVYMLNIELTHFHLISQMEMSLIGQMEISKSCGYSQSETRLHFFFIHGIIHLFTTVSIQEALYLNPVHLQGNICNHHQET